MGATTNTAMTLPGWAVLIIFLALTKTLVNCHIAHISTRFIDKMHLYYTYHLVFNFPSRNENVLKYLIMMNTLYFLDSRPDK